MLRLTVVGNRDQVFAECQRRRIPVTLRSESWTQLGGTCDVAAPDSAADAARAWQAEPPHEPPYPVGACLCVHAFPSAGILGSRGERFRAW